MVGLTARFMLLGWHGKLDESSAKILPRTVRNCSQGLSAAVISPALGLVPARRQSQTAEPAWCLLQMMMCCPPAPSGGTM